MQSKANQPKRHHFVPQMMLQHFTDSDKNLWFWRREFEYGDVRKSKPKNLFVEKDLYTYINFDGTKDIALERFFSDLEGTGAEFIRQLADIVRSGAVPELDDSAWEFWRHFFFYQLKRSPAFINATSERIGFRETVRATVERIKATESAASIADSHEDLEDRFYKYATLMAQSQAPTDEIISAFQALGLAIFRITDPSKSFIIGDITGATAHIGKSDKTISNVVLFVPLTFDIALGHFKKPRTVDVYNVNREQIRQMNIATAERSSIIAGRSQNLIDSISRRATYRGVTDPEEEK